MYIIPLPAKLLRPGLQFPVIREVHCKKGEQPPKQQVIYHYFQSLAIFSFMMTYCQERWFRNFEQTGNIGRQWGLAWVELQENWKGKGRKDMSIHWAPAPAALGSLSHGLLSTTACEGIRSGISWGLTLAPTPHSHYHIEVSKQPMPSYYTHVRSKALQGEYHTAAQKWNRNLEVLDLTSKFELWSFLLKRKIHFSCSNNVCWWQKINTEKLSNI